MYILCPYVSEQTYPLFTAHTSTISAFNAEIKTPILRMHSALVLQRLRNTSKPGSCPRLEVKNRHRDRAITAFLNYPGKKLTRQALAPLQESPQRVLLQPAQPQRGGTSTVAAAYKSSLVTQRHETCRVLIRPACVQNAYRAPATIGSTSVTGSGK